MNHYPVFMSPCSGSIHARVFFCQPAYIFVCLSEHFHWLEKSLGFLSTFPQDLRAQRVDLVCHTQYTKDPSQLTSLRECQYFPCVCLAGSEILRTASDPRCASHYGVTYMRCLECQHAMAISPPELVGPSGLCTIWHPRYLGTS